MDKELFRCTPEVNGDEAIAKVSCTDLKKHSSPPLVEFISSLLPSSHTCPCTHREELSQFISCKVSHIDPYKMKMSTRRIIKT